MALKDEIFQTIQTAAAQTFNIPADQVTLKTNFNGDLKAKSVNFVQIIGEIEDEFGVEVNFMNFRRNATVGDAVNFVEDLLS